MELAEELIELPSSFITLNPGDRYSDFGVNRLRDHGLGSFIDKIISQQTLDREEAEKLLSLSLPLVMKLGELHRMYSESDPKTQLLKPVFTLEILSEDSNEEFEKRIFAINSQIDEFLTRCPEVKEVWLAFSIIRFDDHFMDRVSRLRRRLNSKVRFVGPTAGEIKAIPWIKDADGELLLKRLMKSLLDTGFCSLDGGADLSILSTGCEAGLEVSVAQLIKAGLQGFVNELFTIKDTLGANPNFNVWTPRFKSVLDDLEPVPSSPLGVEILRAIIIARLALPHSVRIQAPVSLLQPKFAHVVTNFGVTDLGYVSAIGDKHLELPGYLEVREFLAEL